MIGRRVASAWDRVEGIVAQWNPLISGACDTVVTRDDGSQIAIASRMLKPADGKGPLPCAIEVRKQARRAQAAQLREIQAQFKRDFRKPWPGAEFGKVLIGRAIDGALKDSEKPE